MIPGDLISRNDAIEELERRKGLLVCAEPAMEAQIHNTIDMIEKFIWELPAANVQVLVKDA